MNRKRLLFVALVVLIWMVGYLVLVNRGEIISPWLDHKFGEEEKMGKVKMGFLPTWMVGKTRVYTKEINRLVFLGVEVDEDGKLKWDAQAKKIESESFNGLKRGVEKEGGGTILGVKLFDGDEIDDLMMNGEEQENLINDITNARNKYGFYGVNIDFEDMSDPQRLLSDDFFAFLDRLKLVSGELSVDVFANLVIKGDGEKVKKLMERVDQLVVMGYDFHTAGSDYIGPVAPINSVAGERNLMEVASKLTSIEAVRSKVVLAIPLYGYEWETVDAGGEARVIGSGQTMTWGRAKKVLIGEEGGLANVGGLENLANLKAGEVAVGFDELAQVPRLVYKKNVTKTRTERIRGTRRTRRVNYVDEEIWQCYFEDERSLGAKLDLAKQNEWGGVAFWALGYEGEGDEVWEMVSDKI